MRETHSIRNWRRMGPGMALGALLAAASGGAGEAAHAFGRSLASELLAARTQSRILRLDDASDSTCQDRRFLDATVVKAPQSNGVSGTIEERKWQEYWTLDRCGTTVGYWVFYTEVGAGGAYFSILGSD